MQPSEAHAVEKKVPSKLRAWLRVLGVFSIVVAVSVWWTWGQVRAQLSERAMSIGQSLQQVTAEQQGTTRLELNGEPLALNSRSTKLSVTEVLDRFAEQCAQHSGGADAELEQLATKRPKLAASLDWRRLGVFRTGGDQQAAAGCFADTGTAGLRGLATRLAEVLETGDFSRLGQLRYVHARRSQGGDSTHVITVWTEGQLKLEQ